MNCWLALIDFNRKSCPFFNVVWAILNVVYVNYGFPFIYNFIETGMSFIIGILCLPPSTECCEKQ